MTTTKRRKNVTNTSTLQALETMNATDKQKTHTFQKAKNAANTYGRKE
ncbi:MAG TPA: hypothetical protein VEY51_10405 [Chondromyces sp.]|nr:hypothetical protein [Chondromyces sp.]